MRRKERIPLVLAKLDFAEFITDFKFINNPTHIASEIDKNALRDFWFKNPDLRLTQVLVQMNYIPNALGMWYYYDECNWLIEKGYYKWEELHFWGVNYDKDNKRLPETIFKPLCELTSDHIQNILEWFAKKPSSIQPTQEYMDYFRSRVIKGALDSTDGRDWVNNLLNDLGLD
jgi:hypothetical protein